MASVLLAVGVAGSLSTLAAAARLRHGASVREELAARAEDRLGWFLARGCAAGDTAWTSPPSATVTDQWTSDRADSEARLSLALAARSSAMWHRLDLTVEVPCP